jgi:hypothetical protein
MMLEATMTTKYGDSWKLELDERTGSGWISGSDVDWERYRVVRGMVPGLILNEEELAWIESVWAGRA